MREGRRRASDGRESLNYVLACSARRLRLGPSSAVIRPTASSPRNRAILERVLGSVQKRFTAVSLPIALQFYYCFFKLLSALFSFFIFFFLFLFSGEEEEKERRKVGGKKKLREKGVQKKRSPRIFSRELFL